MDCPRYTLEFQGQAEIWTLHWINEGASLINAELVQVFGISNYLYTTRLENVEIFFNFTLDKCEELQENLHFICNISKWLQSRKRRLILGNSTI